MNPTTPARQRSGLALFWTVPLFFIQGTVQHELSLISWSGLLFTLSVFPMALLTGYAYERAGVPAAMAIHFGTNATIAVLTVNTPLTQAFVFAVQIVVALTLIATQRDHRTNPSVHSGQHLVLQASH